CSSRAIEARRHAAPARSREHPPRGKSCWTAERGRADGYGTIVQSRRTRESGHLQDLLLLHRLMLEERLGQRVQLMPILLQQADSFGMALPQHALYFDSDRAGRRFAIWLRHAEPGWEIVAWGEGHWPQLVAHVPAGHHLPSQGARLLDVVFCTCRAATVDHLLGGPAAHRADDPRLQVFL